MNGFFTDAPYIAAILGATLGFAAFGMSIIKDLGVKRRFYDFALGETEAALVSADRVLKNGATPPEIRNVLLGALEARAEPELGRKFVAQYASLQSSKKKRPSASNPLSVAMDKLHVTHPDLAADSHTALMGIILALPLMHADKIEVSEIAGLEYAGEGATNPGSVFDRASKALSGIDKGKGNGKGIDGGFAAA